MAKNAQKPEGSKSDASKFGQKIGNAFAEIVDSILNEHVNERHPEYELFKGKKGKKTIKLEILGGFNLQMDGTIVVKSESASPAPVALVESKWLKDGRHHNDKGAWILQLKEIKKTYPTIRGLVAALAGYWTMTGPRVSVWSESGIRTIQVATDIEVYSTLQQHLDDFLGSSTFTLDAEEMRESYPRPNDLVRFILHLERTEQLKDLARSWLEFKHPNANGKLATGTERIKQVVDEILSPLPPTLTIKQFEVALQVETGNTIYQAFSDFEEAIDFIQKYAQNPQAILEKIKPKGVA